MVTSDVLFSAAYLGYYGVLQEALSLGYRGLYLKNTLLTALQYATHLGRALELMKLFEGVGVAVSADELGRAVASNRNGRISCALAAELDLYAKTNKGGLLKAALQACNGEMAHELLDAGARPQPIALTLACSTKDDVLFERLLRAGANPRDSNAFYAVARAGRPGMLALLLAPPPSAFPLQPPYVLFLPPLEPAAPAPLEPAAPGPFVPVVPPTFGATDRQMQIALSIACSFGSVECVELLLQAGVDPVASNALEDATRGGHLGLVRRLLGLGCYTRHTADRRLSAALQSSARHGPIEMTEEILRAGADPARLLRQASSEGRLLVTRALLATGCIQPEQSEMAEALEMSCLTGKTMVVRQLLAWGADPAQGLSPAAEGGPIDLVRALLASPRCAADPSCVEAALRAACRCGRLEVAQELLRAGADPLAGLGDAARGGWLEVVRLLLGAARGTGAAAAASKATADAPAAAAEAAAGEAAVEAGAWPARSQMLLDAALVRACEWVTLMHEQTEVVGELLAAGADPQAALQSLEHTGNEEVMRLLAAGACVPPGRA